MCYPVCGMMHIKEPLLLIGKSSPCGGSGFPISLSEWSFTICLMPYFHSHFVQLHKRDACILIGSNSSMPYVLYFQPVIMSQVLIGSNSSMPNVLYFQPVIMSQVLIGSNSSMPNVLYFQPVIMSQVLIGSNSSMPNVLYFQPVIMSPVLMPVF